MRDIIKHILKEEKQSKFFGTIDRVLNDLLYVDFITESLQGEEIYSAVFKCNDYIKVLSDNPYDASMLEVAIEDNSYNVNYIDNELYGNEHLEKENREMVTYITFFITSVFKIEGKIKLKEIKTKIKEFLNYKIKKYAIENDINLYEKHDLKW
tara:strand:- start:113 stop:571 length:459 start_codon:yes stop_codon:yes gene_type:complete